MAKLSKQNAKAASDKASDWEGGFAVLPPGVYLCRLLEVDSSRSGPSGPYWTWKYETAGIGDEPAGRFLWDNTSLSEKAIGRLGKVFEAFGTTPDTETDDLVGLPIAVEVKIGTIRGGDRQGESRNEIVAVHPADVHALYEDFMAEQGAGVASADDY